MLKQHLHICNPNTPELPGWKSITSKQELLKAKPTKDSVILVSVHLNWEANKLSANYGFDIAIELRTNVKFRFKQPIIFYSPLPVEFFELKSKNEIKYKILFGRGSAFIEIPFKESELSKIVKNTEALSDAALHDVSTMLCNLKGIVIDKLNHDLKFEADIDFIIGSVSAYLSTEQKRIIELDYFVFKLKETVKIKDKNGFLNEKLKFITLCNRELTEKGRGKPETKMSKHKILVIDDLSSEIDHAKRNLKNSFIVKTAKTGKKAMSILSKDLKNEIVAVVSDWRLFTDEKQNYWQSLQGYEILEYAAKNGIRSLFAFTSQADFVVHQLRNIMGIRFSVFKKENLKTPDQWKVFGDVLHSACDETLQIIANIPESDNWRKSERSIDSAEKARIKKSKSKRKITSRGEKGISEAFYVLYPSLHQQYLGYLHSTNRDILFRAVEEKADEIWQYLIGLRDEHNKYDGVDILRNRFGVETPKDAQLFPVLVLRRIWMALWYYHVGENKKLSQEEITEHSKFIYANMHNQGYISTGANSQSVEQTKLCISISQVRNRKMLPEEYAWMRKWQLLVVR